MAAGVEVDRLDLEQALVVDRRHSEQGPERRHGPLGQPRHLGQLLVVREPRALAGKRRQELPVHLPVGREHRQDEPRLRLHEHGLGARVQLGAPHRRGGLAGRHGVVVGEPELDPRVTEERQEPIVWQVHLSSDEKPEPREAVANAVELVGGGRNERQAVAADVVTEQRQSGLDRDRVRGDREQVEGGPQLCVDLAGALGVARLERPHLLGNLPADDVGVDEDAADSAQLEERLQQVAVARIELEPRRDDVPCLASIRMGLLHRPDVRDLGQPGDRLRLDVDHDAARDVVDDDRAVGRAAIASKWATMPRCGGLT